MRTNIDIDEKLIAKAMKVLKVNTKKEAVDLALRNVLRKQANHNMRNMLGKGWGWPEDDRRTTSVEKDVLVGDEQHEDAK